MYGTEPGDSSTELEEAETVNDDAENERGPLNTVTEESRPILRRSSRRRRVPSPCHLCDCEIRKECTREMDLPRVLRTQDLGFSLDRRDVCKGLSL